MCANALANFEITTNQLFDTTAVLFPITRSLQNFSFSLKLLRASRTPSRREAAEVNFSTNPPISALNVNTLLSD